MRTEKHSKNNRKLLRFAFSYRFNGRNQARAKDLAATVPQRLFPSPELT
jgi:hypothetical protein